MHISFKPPMIDGVSPSCVFLPSLKNLQKTNGGQSYATILEFLIQQFPQISKQIWLDRIEAQKIYHEAGTLVGLDSPYAPNSKIYYYRELPYEEPIPFEEQILFQNEHLLVVDKPHFLPVTPTGRFVKQSLLVRLKQRLNCEDITPIHRLDRETAGVMLFSLQPQTRPLYQTLFQDRKVSKQYQAIAAYRDDLEFPRNYQSHMVKGQPFFTMQETEGPANSFTRIELLETRQDLSQHLARYQLYPLSGKQHQLRVHMAALGIPILNDPFYPKVQLKADNDYSAPLQLLAQRIAFVDPLTRQAVEYNSLQTLIL
ncbi:pseudouridine synthase [Alkanindiges illinoisensis]|uniref:pseudouridine synthase n=1 Tax=Alkanindiges illinoisensis TaxID=197183 RepID=UPI000479BA43|nr:pseudouridine synthase [Alkanindiges illinoisensis]